MRCCCSTAIGNDHVGNSPVSVILHIYCRTKVINGIEPLQTVKIVKYAALSVNCAGSGLTKQSSEFSYIRTDLGIVTGVFVIAIAILDCSC